MQSVSLMNSSSLVIRTQFTLVEHNFIFFFIFVHSNDTGRRMQYPERANIKLYGISENENTAKYNR